MLTEMGLWLSHIIKTKGKCKVSRYMIMSKTAYT